MRTTNNYKAPRVVVHALTVLALLTAAPNAIAGDGGENLTGNFTVGVSANAGVLFFANDPTMLPMMQTQAGWVFGNQLQAMFNMPALQIINEGGSSGNIVEVAITIGDNRFNFTDFLAGGLTQEVPNFTLPVGVFADVETITEMAATPGADDADRLVLTFGNGGLAPGESTLFKIKIASDSNFPQFMPSFDQVFFDANGEQAFGGGIPNPSTDDNSLVFVTYEDPDTGDRRTADPVPLLDFAVSGNTGTAIHPMPIIDPHFISGQLNPVPEPTSIAIAVAGIGLLMTGRRRRI